MGGVVEGCTATGCQNFRGTLLMRDVTTLMTPPVATDAIWFLLRCCAVRGDVALWLWWYDRLGLAPVEFNGWENTVISFPAFEIESIVNSRAECRAMSPLSVV